MFITVTIPKPLQIDSLAFEAPVKFLLALLLFDYDHFLHHVTIQYLHFFHYMILMDSLNFCLGGLASAIIVIVSFLYILLASLYHPE